MNELVVVVLGLALTTFFAWAFAALPHERWQIIATVPKEKSFDGRWSGMNLTFYGFFVATSNLFAVLVMLVLLASVGVEMRVSMLLITLVFAICWPASRLLARAIERKKFTFTIGGAVFIGVLTTPLIVSFLNAWKLRIPLLPALAAGAIAYTFGEGVGRLACISFGCCYGQRIDNLPAKLQWFFRSFSFIFDGVTKKAAYEGGLEGVRVVPIQGITAMVLAVIGCAGTYLFLESSFCAALITCAISTQVWRFISELLRADHRGKIGKLTAYQVMSLAMSVYVVCFERLWATNKLLSPPPDILAGVWSIWDPAVLLFCQMTWLLVFLHTGRSMVTGATLSFFVRRDRI
jgi:hypothetical protein